MVDLLLLKHAVETSIGTTIEWCKERGVSFDVRASETFFEEKEHLDYRAIAVFGGDMEVWDTQKYSWLKKEKEALQSWIAQDKPVFGVCLGGQLLAEALGSHVQPMDEWEIGWYPVTLHSGKTLIPLHFHSSRFSLPVGAQRIAVGAQDANQGFRVRDRYVGYQFHTEIDAHRIEDIVKRLGRDKKGVVQTKDELLKGFEIHGDALKAWYFRELDHWWSSVIRP